MRDIQFLVVSAFKFGREVRHAEPRIGVVHIGRRRIEALLIACVGQGSRIVIPHDRVGRRVESERSVRPESGDTAQKLDGLHFAAEP